MLEHAIPNCAFDISGYTVDSWKKEKSCLINIMKMWLTIFKLMVVSKFSKMPKMKGVLNFQYP